MDDREDDPVKYPLLYKATRKWADWDDQLKRERWVPLGIHETVFEIRHDPTDPDPLIFSQWNGPIAAWASIFHLSAEVITLRLEMEDADPDREWFEENEVWWACRDLLR